MGTYKGIQGYSVQSLASDPPAAQSVGQLWYNSASNVWKVGVESTGAWAAGGALSSPRGEGTGAGTQTAGIAIGGRLTPDLVQLLLVLLKLIMVLLGQK